MTDTALIENGKVTQVWRNATIAEVDPNTTMTGLVEFPPKQVVAGMVWDGANLSVPARVITEDDVIAERERRLSLGFDFDFGDARGVHRIGTTDRDMVGWNEVTQAANSRVNTNKPTEVINIVTDTGPATVTAREWQDILYAASVVRQPIWAGSFFLMAQSPIPADYATNDAYWS